MANDAALHCEDMNLLWFFFSFPKHVKKLCYRANILFSSAVLGLWLFFLYINLTTSSVLPPSPFTTTETCPNVSELLVSLTGPDNSRSSFFSAEVQSAASLTALFALSPSRDEACHKRKALLGEESSLFLLLHTCAQAQSCIHSVSMHSSLYQQIHRMVAMWEWSIHCRSKKNVVSLTTWRPDLLSDSDRSFPAMRATGARALLGKHRQRVFARCVQVINADKRTTLRSWERKKSRHACTLIRAVSQACV